MTKEPGFASRQLQGGLHSDVNSELLPVTKSALKLPLLNEWMNELYFTLLPD